MTMVTVLGGTGETGSRVAAKLRDRGVEVRAVSRSNAVPFDWSHEATWPAVLEGANAIYVIVDESPHWVERLGRFLDLSSARGGSESCCCPRATGSTPTASTGWRA